MDIQSDDLSVEQVQPIFGENLNYKLNLTLAEVVHGGEKEVIYKCQEVCPECQGISRIKSQENKKGFWGALFHSPTCKACKDTGRRQAKQTINVLIPPGVEKGMQIRVEGAGNAGLFGGVNGDLIIEIEVQEDSRFLQIGHDLFYYQYITEYQALNGVTLEIATIGGQANLVIPPESLAGQRFRLRKKGIPYFQEEKCGDQIVILTHDKNKLSEKRQFLDVLDSFAEAWLDTRKTELRSQKANDLICQVTYDDLDNNLIANPNALHRGEDLKCRVEISLEEAALGTEKELKYSFLLPCSQCHGSGFYPSSESLCIVCQGSGQEKKTHRIKFYVPAGVLPTTQLKIAGMGSISVEENGRSDLYIGCNIKPHPLFSRRESNLLMDIALNPLCADDGTEVDIPLIDGKREKLRIPEGTCVGQSFTLLGRGMPFLDGKGCGNLIVTVMKLIEPLCMALPDKDSSCQLKIDEFAGGIILQSLETKEVIAHAKLTLMNAGLSAEEIQSLASQQEVSTVIEQQLRDQQKWAVLNEAYSQVFEKYRRLKMVVTIETDVSLRLKYESELTETEKARQQIEREMEEIEHRKQQQDKAMSSLQKK